MLGGHKDPHVHALTHSSTRLFKFDTLLPYWGPDSIGFHRGALREASLLLLLFHDLACWLRLSRWHQTSPQEASALPWSSLCRCSQEVTSGDPASCDHLFCGDHSSSALGEDGKRLLNIQYPTAHVRLIEWLAEVICFRNLINPFWPSKQ